MKSDITNLSGQTIKGYELRELIGHGGFGAVYRAYQPTVDREVAIKLILPEYANSPEFVRRFESEAQVVARLEHPHITPLYDYWREPSMAILVMRLLRGGSLQDSLETRGAWSPSEVVKLVEQIASALTTAHRNNIVHRDLKPANILLDEDGNAYLADFGIAKQLTQQQLPLTQEDRYGSPAFISPEQVIGQAVSAQTDIYSLGMVIYVMLTGQTPFFDTSTDTVIRKQLSDTLPPIQTLQPNLPYAVNIIIWRATSKRPEARYPDALSLATELKQVIAPDNISSALTHVSTPGIPKMMAGQQNPSTVILEAPSILTNPYKGLEAFQESDAGDFYGRKTLIERLVKRLGHGEHGSQFLAIVGPSGSGKSSIALAGLIPALKRGALFGSQEWFYLHITPGANPLQQLADGLLSLATQTPASLTELFGPSDSSIAEVIHAILPEDDSELVLLIDQFEELFTLVNSEDIRGHFLRLLTNSVQTHASRLRLIITLRADFYDRPLQYPGLSELIRDNTEIVLPMSLPEMEEAIVEPSARYGIQFEYGLVSRIISEVNQQPGALPLLQFALTELFNKRDGYLLKISSYEQIGGVFGALARSAENVYLSLDSYSQTATQQMFLRLVSLNDEGTHDTRRRATRDELSVISNDKAVVQHVLDEFGKHRLLTFDYEQGSRTPTVEIAHEALIRVWKRLREWIQNSREELQLQQRLAVSVHDWQAAAKDKSYLASGGRLTQFESLALSPIIKLTHDESAFLWASIEGRRRATRRQHNFMVAIILVALITSGLAALAFDRQRVAEIQTKRANEEVLISRSRELAVTSLRPENRLDLALLLSLEGLNAADTFEARNSLVSNLENKPHLIHFLSGHTDTVRTLAFSPNGQLLASAGKDQSIILWDTQTYRQVGSRLKGHTNWVNGLAFRPDSQMLVSVDIDGTICRWDTSTGNLIGQPISSGTDELWSIAFSPNGKVFATGDKNGSIQLWDAVSGEAIGSPLLGHSDLVYALAYNPEGTILASGSGDGTIRLWDTKTNVPIGEPLAEHNGSVLTLAFSQDGTRLASAGIDDTVIFWDPSNGEYLNEIQTGHTKRIKSITFSRDSALLATASDDNSVRIWDTSTLEQVGSNYTGYSDHIWSVAFSPKTSQIAASAADDTIIIWDTNSVEPLIRNETTENSNILAVAFSPKGDIYATGGGSKGDDSLIHLWDSTTDKEIGTLANDEGYVTDLAFSPKGNLLLSASSNNTLNVWDVQTKKTTATIEMTGDNRYIPVAFSPDGEIIASGNTNGEISLWSVKTGQQVGQTLIGHTGAILALAFNKDGSMLASGSTDKIILLWNVASHKTIGKPFVGHEDEVWTVKFSPDSNFIASAGTDRTLRVWNVSTHQQIGQPLVGHTDRIKTIDFTPDGTMLISGSQDNTIMIWDIERRLPLGNPLHGHTNFINALAISPDGNSMITAGEDNKIVHWEIGIAYWRESACQIANRNFTTAEWERFFGNTPYQTTCPNPP